MNSESLASSFSTLRESSSVPEASSTILAGELLIVARFLDRAETILRGPARRARAVWASVPAPVRILIGIIVPVCGAALGSWALLSVLR